MEIGVLHTHIAVVTLFLAFLFLKTIMLIANKKELLARVRKLKMIDPILGTLMLITGVYLLSFYGMSAPLYLWVKLIVVLLVIPIGIMAFKNENKLMAVFALLLTIYLYGVSEASSLTFNKVEDVKEVSIELDEQVEHTAAVDVLKTGKELYLAECKKCHGKDGKKGLFKSPDLTQTKLTLSERVAWIKQGKGVMPSYKGKLTEEEITAVAAYLDELK